MVPFSRRADVKPETALKAARINYYVVPTQQSFIPVKRDPLPPFMRVSARERLFVLVCCDLIYCGTFIVDPKVAVNNGYRH